MDLPSLEWLSPLAAIIVINLALAGDNAIVIALAARRLPERLRARAIRWGAVGAVVVRIVMTAGVVWLLSVPGLQAAGGALLVWMAYKLLLPGDPHEGVSGGATTFWAAMGTIVVADAVTGVDNVLAVAGAAHGNYLLVVVGLVLSVPIVVWGSGWLLRWIERFPAIVYAGAGVLAWTAVQMMTSEPLLKAPFDSRPWIVPLAYVGVVGGVLAAGFAGNRGRTAA